MASELKIKTVKGILWSLTERFGTRGMTLVIGIILARLLTPEAFGLVGLVTVFSAIARVFISGGFGQAYIQKKEVSDVDASTIFYTNLLISIFIYFLLWFAAPLISKFYEQKELTELIRVIGIVIIIYSFNVIQQAQIKRGLDFKRKTKVTILAVLLSGAAGIGAAYGGLGVWSLVIKQVGNVFILTTGLWITSNWKPTLQFSKKSLNEMFSFGGWVFLSNILKTVFDNIYKLTIGKFFPVAELGFYTKSKTFQQSASQELAMAISAVSFPVLAKLQDDKIRMQKATKKFLTHTFVAIAPIMVILAIIAEPFVILVLTEKWAPMIPYLQLLTLVGLLYPIHSVNNRVILASGKSRLNFKLAMLKNGLRVINIIVMYRFGVIYIILGEVILSFISLAIYTYYTKRLINYGLFSQLKDIGLILSGAIVAGAFTYSLTLVFSNYWLILLAGPAFFIGLYLSFHYFLNRKFFTEIISLKETFK